MVCAFSKYVPGERSIFATQSRSYVVAFSTSFMPDVVTITAIIFARWLILDFIIIPYTHGTYARISSHTQYVGVAVNPY